MFVLLPVLPLIHLYFENVLQTTHEDYFNIDIFLLRQLPLQPSTNGETPLHVAARHGDYAVVTLLLAANADVLAKNKSNETALDVS